MDGKILTLMALISLAAMVAGFPSQPHELFADSLPKLTNMDVLKLFKEIAREQLQEKLKYQSWWLSSQKAELQDTEIADEQQREMTAVAVECVSGATLMKTVKTCDEDNVGFTCLCPTGFSGDGTKIGTGCSDIDECDQEFPAHDCLFNASCVNTVGSFTCSCPTGFMGDGRTSGTGCPDVNECDSATHNCAPTAICVNTHGTFTCDCLSGYGGDGTKSGTGCSDINECDSETHNCASNATCVNILGTFTCECPTGFRGDGTKSGTGCSDINECDSASPTHDCVSDAICVNNEGSFTCSCPVGLGGDGRISGTLCTDIDECQAKDLEGSLANDCVTDATCLNTEGSFTCSCPSGLGGDGRDSGTGCIGPDEISPDDCVEGASFVKSIDCDTDDVAGFTCSCPIGFGGDGTKSGTGCSDVNECDSVNPTHDCASNAICENTEGNFTCRCPSGSEGDGRQAGSGCKENCVKGDKDESCLRSDGSRLCVCPNSRSCGCDTTENKRCCPDLKCKSTRTFFGRNFCYT